MSDSPSNPGPNRYALVIVLAVLVLLCLPIAFVLICTSSLKGEGPTKTAPAAKGKAGDEASIKAVLAGQARAWNAGDLERFMTGYWNSKELTFFSGGTINKGYAAVLARYRKRYQSKGQEMGKLAFSDLDVTLMGANDATARGRWKVVLAKKNLEGLFTLVLRRFPDGWKIVHDHTSQADPPKP